MSAPKQKLRVGMLVEGNAWKFCQGDGISGLRRRLLGGIRFTSGETEKLAERESPRKGAGAWSGEGIHRARPGGGAYQGRFSWVRIDWYRWSSWRLFQSIWR